MSYDLFISYSRRDNQEGRITQLVDRIKQTSLRLRIATLSRSLTSMKFTGCRTGGSASCRVFANRTCFWLACRRRI
jgi:hypothetical protein